MDNNSVNKITVLNAYKKHKTLSWADFTTKGIFTGIEPESDKAEALTNALWALVDDGLIRQKENVPATFELVE